MGPFLPYSVEIFDGHSHRQMAEFRRLEAAVAAARHAFDSPRTTLAVVRDLEGVMVYCHDGEREWSADELAAAVRLPVA